MIETEVQDALRELVDSTGATSARIVEDPDERSGVPARTLPLGGGEYLRVEEPSRADGRTHDLELAIDRCVRQLRAIRRRWEAARLPVVVVTREGAGSVPPTVRVLGRVRAFLDALAGSAGPGANALVVVRGSLLASAHEPDDVQASRWPFLARRVLATHAPHSSHGEVVDPDAYAMSFWYDAALVVLLAEGYALDFVRHRARQVAREIAQLLPLLEPDPDAPAMIRRRPPTGPV